MPASLLLALTALAAPLQEAVPIREVLAIESLGERRRSPVYTDALQAQLVHGTFVPPGPGDKLTSATGDEREWRAYEANDEGWFQGPPFRGGWASALIDVPTTGAWRLDARGHSLVLVDGEPHMGDHYTLGLTRTPLFLAAGTHELLFRCGRGRLRATLERAQAPVYIESKDRTLPDVLRGEHEGGELLAGIIVCNAGAKSIRQGRIVARCGDDEAVTLLPKLHGSSYRKCAVNLPVPDALEGEADALEVTLVLQDAEGAQLHTDSLELRVRDPKSTHVRTFTSEIDGSVQYYAVTPPAQGTEAERPGLVLSLHGAGVEARGQAACYKPKDWCAVVAPTNRRPFGFDWEDWGRLDALEVLAIARKTYDTDPRRTYLTGHSMGGHGTWQLGAHFPDRWAAIAPSAGWRDFWSYAGAGTFPEEDAVGALLARSANASRTLLLERNYLMSGIYVLHGDRDETVSVDEARAMRSELADFHPNFAYYERAGAGHWWGNACMDWPPLFEFLRQNVLPARESIQDIDFTTVDPAVSSTCNWVSVEAQEERLAPSHIVAHLDAKERSVRLELDNVARLRLASLPLEPGELRVTVDGEDLDTRIEARSPSPPILLARAGGRWRTVESSPAGGKSPRRSGPFKQAFQNRMVFVYGTRGTPEENAWAFDKARFDHETWRYRGNGAVDVVSDRELTADGYEHRNVILYGNRDTNMAFDVVLEEPAFDLARDKLSVGERVLEGEDLALIACHPRKGSPAAMVAVIGGTGLPGARVTDFLPYFVSGVGYPDWVVFGADFPTVGLEGVIGAGFFDNDWSAGESAWR